MISTREVGGPSRKTPNKGPGSKFQKKKNNFVVSKAELDYIKYYVILLSLKIFAVLFCCERGVFGFEKEFLSIGERTITKIQKLPNFHY